MTRTILHAYPSFAFGGAQMRFIQLANHFGPRYRHLLVAMDGNAEGISRLKPDVDVTLLKAPRRRGATLSDVASYRQVLREHRPDLLVTSNWGTIEWAMANFAVGISHLHMEDGFGPEEAHRQLPRRVWTRRLVLRRSTVMLPSMTLYAIARDIWRLPEHRLIHVPNGIDCARFAVPPDPGFAASLGIGEGDPVIGTVAALRAEKKLHRLIEAVAQVIRERKARLAIVGDGPERAALTAHAASLGIADRVIFTGTCPTPEKLLPSFDVFALSSDTEQMPLSALEAMAAGRAIAATDVGDLRDMVTPENRPYLVAREATPLAAALLALLTDPDHAHRIGAANACRAVERFDQDRMFDAYAALFDGNAHTAQVAAVA
jgi:glycosyltransferase involved in cell wall biosynthesis